MTAYDTGGVQSSSWLADRPPEVADPLERLRLAVVTLRQREPFGCNTGNVELAPGVTIDDDVLEMFCRTNGVRRLGLFGSALRGELRPDSDIDLLVEFEPGRVPGLLHLAALELELMELLGREVDLRTAADLSRHFRDEVSASARVLYDAA